jgi:hypothetical protein
MVSSTNKTDCLDIAENIVESGIKHHNPIITLTLDVICDNFKDPFNN